MQLGNLTSRHICPVLLGFGVVMYCVFFFLLKILPAGSLLRQSVMSNQTTFRKKGKLYRGYQCCILGEYVLVCVYKTPCGENSSYSFLAETFPSAVFSCNTKGPVTSQAVYIPKKPFGKTCQTLPDSSLWGFHCKFSTLW